MNSTRFPAPLQFLDENAYALAGGFIYTYEAGTTTFCTTYKDAELTVANENPIILDSAGRCQIYVDRSTKAIVQNASGEFQYNEEFFVPEEEEEEVIDFDIPASVREVLISEYPDIKPDDYGFDNSAGFQAALDDAQARGFKLVIPSGVYYFQNGITLNAANRLAGINRQSVQLVAIDAFTLITLNTNTTGDITDTLHSMTLTGSDESDPDSIAIKIGTNNDTIYTDHIHDITLESGTWYRGIYSTARTDNCSIERVTCPGGVFGYSFIEMTNDSVDTLSTSPTIDACTAVNTGDPAWGRCRYGIRVRGTHSARISNCSIDGFDHNYLSESLLTSGGNKSTQNDLVSCISGDSRNFVVDNQVWTPSTSYQAGDKVVNATQNGYVYKAVNGGTSSSSASSSNDWSTSQGVYINDGSCRWLRIDYAGVRWKASDSRPASTLCKPTKEYANGWIYQSGPFTATTGDTEPAWPATTEYGHTVQDGSVTWTAVHRSVSVASHGDDDDAKFNIKSLSGGSSIVQYELESGAMEVSNVDSTTGINDTESDVSFFYTGAGVGTFTANTSRLVGNFRPYFSTTDDTSHAAVQLHNTKLVNDDYADLRADGVGTSVAFLGNGNILPVTEIGVGDSEIDIDIAKVASIRAKSSCVINIVDTFSRLNDGKIVEVFSDTASNFIIRWASEDIEYRGSTLDQIVLSNKGDYVRLLMTRGALRILDTAGEWTKPFHYKAGATASLTATLSAATASSPAGTAAQWNKRDLENFTTSDSSAISSPVTNEMMLSPGEYTISGFATFYETNHTKIRIVDEDDNVLAESSLARVSGSAQTQINIPATHVTIDSSTNVHLQYIVELSNQQDYALGFNGQSDAGGSSLGGEFGEAIAAGINVRKYPEYYQ